MHMKNNLLCPVRKCDGLQLASLSEIYFNSFPEEERRPLDDILCRAAAGDKGLNLMLIHASDGNVSGMLTYWDLGDVIYIEHFAIDSSCRGDGLGGCVLDEFVARCSKPVLFEVEPAGSNSMADRRIAFYRRHGFECMDYPYVQPPYSPGLPPVGLTLMCTSCDGIDPGTVSAALHRIVYGVGADAKA